MSPIALVRLPAIRPVFQYLARRNAPVEEYALGANIPIGLLQREEALIPFRQAARFVREAAAREGIPSLGLVAAEAASIDSIGVYGRVMRQAPTLADALQAAVRLDRVFSSGERWWIEPDGAEVQLCHLFVDALEPGDHQLDHYSVALAVQTIRLAAGSDWTPTDVQMHSRPFRDVRESPLFAGTRLTFGQRTSRIRIPGWLMRRPILSPAPRLLSATDLEAWRRSAPAADLRGSMLQVLASLAPRFGHVRIHDTADALGVSIRTLQRRLSDEGLRFEDIVRDMRLDLAADLLARTDSKIIDIALDLGYSDHAHFTRAFHRWTGLSPVEYRRRRRSDPTRPAAVSA